MSDVSKSLRTHTKSDGYEQITHGRSPKMSEWGNRSFFEQIAHSLIFLQKQEIRLENQWANSQPWKIEFLLSFSFYKK